jgi:hypothetical protein
MKILDVFSSASRADENIFIVFVGLSDRRKREHIFVGHVGWQNRVIFIGNRRKTAYFHLFYSVGPISLFGFRPIFVGLWPMKIGYFPVVCIRSVAPPLAAVGAHWTTVINPSPSPSESSHSSSTGAMSSCRRIRESSIYFHTMEHLTYLV